MKAVMFLVAATAAYQPSPWADLYQRLVERSCSHDEQNRDYIGKKRVLGRIAGQMIALLYGLLRTDAEVVARTPARDPLPEPMLYDPVVHHAHQAGGYEPMKVRTRALHIVGASPRQEPAQP